MKRRMLVLALLVLAGGPAMASPGVGAPPPAVTVTDDPDAVQYLRLLEGSIQKQTEDEAVAGVKNLLIYWKDPTVKEETKKEIPGLLAWYARRKDPTVALAGIRALEDVGKGEGAQNLVAVLAVVLDRDDTPSAVTAAVFAALKRVADPDPAVTEPLVKLFVYRDNAVVAKVADVFAGYGDAAPDVRRHLFEELLRSFEGVASQAQATAKGANKSALSKWVAVGGSVLGAMNALSHQQLVTMAAARRWFNDHHRSSNAWN
jgi:hypothetical protein